MSHFYKESLQGDASLIDIYKNFGVETTFKGTQLCLKKVDHPVSKTIELNLSDSPDIAQTIAVTTFGLGMKCALTGLHTLKIKETDRLVALQNELSKLGGKVSITEDSLFLDHSERGHSFEAINTYNDHRMAMAFAPLALTGPISINNPEVVSKSYPDFWKDLRHIGFVIEIMP